MSDRSVTQKEANELDMHALFADSLIAIDRIKLLAEHGGIEVLAGMKITLGRLNDSDEPSVLMCVNDVVFSVRNAESWRFLIDSLNQIDADVSQFLAKKTS